MANNTNINFNISDLRIEPWNDYLDARNYYLNIYQQNDDYLLSTYLLMIQNYPEILEINISLESELNFDMLNTILRQQFGLTENYSGPENPIEIIQYNEDMEENLCSICMDSFRENQEIGKLGCNHFFHKECIEKWFERKNTCPTCRFVQ